jgi:PAS domain S-box-containing protein
VTGDTIIEGIETAEDLRERLERAERTARKLTERGRALEHERRMFAALVHNTAAGFVALDTSGSVIWANEPFRERFSRIRIAPDAGTGHGATCHQTLCGLSAPCDDCPAARSVRSGEYAHHEFRLWIADRFYNVLASATPIRSGDGSVGQALVMLQDVSDLQVLQRSEEAFRTSENRFRTLYEQVPVGMATVKIDGSFLQVNPAFCTMLGYTASDLLRTKITDVTHPDDLEVSERLARELASGNRRVVEQEKRYIRRDGEVVWGHSAAVLQRDAQGRPAYSVNLIQDITQRKQALKGLEQSRRRYETLVNSMDAIVWETEADAPRFSFVSPRAEQILGYPVERWLTQPRFWRNHIHTEDLDQVLAVHTEAIREGKGFEVEYRMIADDGRSVWVRDTVAVSTAEDGTVRMRGIMVDITGKRQAEEALRHSEEQLRQSQKMEAIGRLAGGIAHDFNNLITTISGYGDLLLRGLGANHPLTEEVRQITKAGVRASDLTAQLLTFSRQQVLKPEVLDLNVVAADMDLMLRRVIGEDIDLVSTLGKQLGAVKADPGQLQQVILNLAVNARDAMPDGGMLTLQTANVDVGVADPTAHPGVDPGAYVMLVMSDTGTGMDEATKARLFEPFFTTKEKGKGTGLGLSTVYGIVTQSGGHLRVESQPDIGTSFVIYLPRESGVGSAPRSEPDDPPELSQGSETVLLVEDDDAVRELACRILEMSGYTVVEAENGIDALALCESRERPIHLLATDLVMPQMGGRDLAMKAQEILPRLKILFLSGYTGSELRDDGRLDADAFFLQKPFTPAALADMVRAVLDGRESPPRHPES